LDKHDSLIYSLINIDKLHLFGNVETRGNSIEKYTRRTVTTIYLVKNHPNLKY